MFYRASLLASILTISQATASFLQQRDQLCNEKGTKICYGAPTGTSQKVNLDDVAYAAAYLRAYGQSSDPALMLTMLPTKATECDEWTLYTTGTVMILGKHIDPKVNSTILFEDIATTIDGGDPATKPSAAKVKASLTGCGVNGGSMNVTVDKTRKEYKTAEYIKSKAVNSGIIIKIVKAPA